MNFTRTLRSASGPYKHTFYLSKTPHYRFVHFVFVTAVAGAFWCFFSRARALRIGANSTYVPREIYVFKMRFVNETMKS